MQLFHDQSWPVQWSCLLSTKSDGPLPPSNELGSSPLMANRVKYLQSNDIAPKQLVSARLCHGVNIVAVNDLNGGQIFNNTDGLSTDSPNMFLAVTVADCVPIYFCDPTKHIVAIVHAGWKGMIAGMPSIMVNHLTKTYGSAPVDLLVGIGPCIQACHFEVGPEVAVKFKAYPLVLSKKKKRDYIDLPLIAKIMLTKSGVPVTHIVSDGRCTVEDSELYSFRRDKNLSTGVMTAVTGWRA